MCHPEQRLAFTVSLMAVMSPAADTSVAPSKTKAAVREARHTFVPVVALSWLCTALVGWGVVSLLLLHTLLARK